MGIVVMSPEDFEQGIKIMSTQALPAIRLLPGYRGGLVLGDPEAGKAVYLTFWETEEDMRRSEEHARVLRQDSAEALGVGEIPLERYEVRVLELPE
jgi:heme-degrading monooxygenase HmoA